MISARWVPRAHSIRASSRSTNSNVATPPVMPTCGKRANFCAEGLLRMFTFLHTISCNTKLVRHKVPRSGSDLTRDGRSFTIRVLSSGIGGLLAMLVVAPPQQADMSLQMLLFRDKLALLKPNKSGYNLMKNAHASRCAPEGAKGVPSGAKSGGMEATCRRCRIFVKSGFQSS